VFGAKSNSSEMYLRLCIYRASKQAQYYKQLVHIIARIQTRLNKRETRCSYTWRSGSIWAEMCLLSCWLQIGVWTLHI